MHRFFARTAIHSSESEQSSDDSGAGDDPHRSRSVPNSLSQLQHAYATGSDSVIPANPEKQFDEQDGQSYCSDLDTRAQSSQRQHLPSVSPVKRRQVAVSESDFDGVENHVLQATPDRLSMCVCRHASPAHPQRRGRRDVPSATPNAVDRLISAYFSA